MGKKKATPKSEDRKILHIKFGVYISDNGDGSPGLHIYRTLAKADEIAEKDDQRYCEDTFEETIRVYADTGELVMDDEEKEKANDKAWTTREKAEKALKADPNNVDLQCAFASADREWQETI